MHPIESGYPVWPSTHSHYNGQFWATLLESTRHDSWFSGLSIVLNVEGSSHQFIWVQGVTRAVQTVSEKLKEVGYRTAHVGKWDVGMAHHSLTPEGRGFDTALSFFTHGPDYFSHKKV